MGELFYSKSDIYWSNCSFIVYIFLTRSIDVHGVMFVRQVPMTILLLRISLVKSSPASGYSIFIKQNDGIILIIFFLFSTGGNVLINVGPTSYGKIMPIFEERLRQMGSWLKVNGEAIYSSVPWKYQNDTTNSNVW